LAAAFPLAKGGVLLQQKYEEAKGALISRAQELGYLDADFSVHEIRIAQPTSTARIRLEMETGQRYFFAATRIEGAPGYPEAFLRRYLAFKPGEAFSYARLGETQLNFTNSERFREVNITPEKAKSREFRVPVLIQLKPGASRTLRQGIGYGTDTGGRFNVRYRDLNVLDRGHEFYSNLFIAERLQGLAIGYILPDSVDIRSSTVLQFNLQREDVSTYTSRLIALELDKTSASAKGNWGPPISDFSRSGIPSASRNRPPVWCCPACAIPEIFTTTRPVLPVVSAMPSIYAERTSCSARTRHCSSSSPKQVISCRCRGGFPSILGPRRGSRSFPMR
jgi:translocation and assembly module TamA